MSHPGAHLLLALTFTAALVACGGGDTPAEPAAQSEPAASPAEAPPPPSPQPAEGAAAEPPAPPAAPEPPPIPQARRAEYERLRARVSEAPEDLSAGCALGTLLRRVERYDEAREVIREALRVGGPRYPERPRPGAREACEYELGRILVAQGEHGLAVDHFRRAMATPIERRRPIVREALLTSLRAAAIEDCGSIGGQIPLRALLAQGEDEGVRACVHNAAPVCRRAYPDEDHPGAGPDGYTDFRRVSDELAFGLYAEELHVISGPAERRVVRACDIDLPDINTSISARMVRARTAELAIVRVFSNVTYACDDCPSDEENPYGDCRCDSTFNGDLFFSRRGVFRLAVIADDTDADAVGPVRWDQPELRTSNALVRVEGDEREHVAPWGRLLFVRGGALVPGPRAPR